jgi:hypothetical protein
MSVTQLKERQVEDIMLARYVSYLIAQNEDQYQQ